MSRSCAIICLCLALGWSCAGAARAETTPWQQAVEPMPVAPVGATGDAAAPASFAVPAGFLVERLFVVPREELGSWVSLATDPKGRLIASDQGNKGLVRITPAPLDGSQPTRVEKIPVAITGAQGLLWAFDALSVFNLHHLVHDLDLGRLQQRLPAHRRWPCRYDPCVGHLGYPLFAP